MSPWFSNYSTYTHTYIYVGIILNLIIYFINLMEFFLVVFSLVLVLATKNANGGGGFSFDEYYYQTFGGNHLTIFDQGNEVQLLLDQSTGHITQEKN